jgi:hypothetical protein
VLADVHASATALWAALAVMALIGVALIGATIRMAFAAGRLSDTVQRIDERAADHEQRLRALERKPERRYHQVETSPKRRRTD